MCDFVLMERTLVLCMFTVGLLLSLLHQPLYTQLGLGFLVGTLYFLSIGLIALLENVAHWK